MGRIAWLYYKKENSQGQIANMLGLSRAQVQRRIKKLTQNGIVEIRINHEMTNCFEKEEKLKKVFGLTDAVVSPAVKKEIDLTPQLGKASALYIRNHISNNHIVGVGMGTTLQAMIPFLEKTPFRNIKIVTLIGSWPKMHRDGPFEVASKLAMIFNAECYYISAPVVADSFNIKKLLLAERSIRQAFEMAREADFLMVGIGNASVNSSLIRAECLTAKEVDSARDMGAVGDILGHYYDRDGTLLKPDFMERVISISPKDLMKHKMVIGVGGNKKIDAIFGALRGGYLKVLITDEDTATELLEASGEQPLS